MISLDAIKGLLAEQWNKDIRTVLKRMELAGALDQEPPQTSDRPSCTPNGMQPTAE